jgi:hypothetical protein
MGIGDSPDFRDVPKRFRGTLIFFSVPLVMSAFLISLVGFFLGILH